MTEQNKTDSLLLVVYRVVRASSKWFAAVDMSTWFLKYIYVGKIQI